MQQLCCLDASMTGYDLVIVIDKNGVVEAEPLDAPRNLLDLLGRVGTGIAGIRSLRVSWPDFYIHGVFLKK